MRKFCIFLLLSLCVFCAHAQQASKDNQDRTRVEWMLSQFHNGQFSAAYDGASSFLTSEDNRLLPQEQQQVRFVQAVSAYRIGHNNAMEQLRRYAADFPLSPNISRVFLYMGVISVNEGKYDNALEWLKRCELNTLSDSDSEDYCFALANAQLQNGNYAGADTLFTVLLGRGGNYITEATYYKAYICYREGSYDEALKGFEKIRDIPAYSETVPFFILQIHFNQARYQEVLNMAGEWEQKQLDQPHRAELLRLQGGASYELHEFHAAKRYYDGFLKVAEEFPVQDAYRIGMLYFMDRNYESAIEYLARAAENNDIISQNATYHLGICYLQLGKEDMARMSFERASLEDFDPSAKEGALFNYALLCYKTSFSPFNEQVNAFERILKEFPDSRYADRIYGYLADAFLTGNNYATAVSFIDKIQKPSVQLQQTRGKLLFLLGVDDFNNGDYAKAMERFNASISQSAKLKENPVEVYFWRGEAFYRMNRLAEAKNDFQRFLNARQSSSLKAWPLAHYDMGYCCFNTGDYANALYWFNKYAAMESIRNDATWPDVLNRIGDCHFKQRDYAKAADYYFKTDQLTPSGNDYAVFQRAFCLGILKQYLEKARLLETFGGRFPESSLTDDALYEEGQAYVSLGENAKAIDVLTRLGEAFPHSDLSRKAGVQTGLLYYQMHETDKSIAAYKQVIGSYPGSQEAATALNDLKSIYVAVNRVQEYFDYVASLGGGFSVKAEEQDSLMYVAAERLMMDEKKTEAAQAYKNYLRQYPTGHYVADANYYCGSLLHTLGFTEEATVYLKAVLPLTGNPYIVPSLTILSESAYKDRQFASALDYYRQLARLTSDRDLRIGAKTGVMRCLAQLGQTESLISASKELMQETNLSPELMREARYHKTMSLIQIGESDLAVKDLEILSKESQTAYGAEARYRLAQYRADAGEEEKAISLANAFLHEGTPHAYWLARTFILLADIYIRQGDDFQAQQYLVSLKENYKGDDDIASMIASRLETIASHKTQE